MPSKLQELQNKLQAKRANLKKIFDQAKSGDRWDLLKADAFQHLTDEAHAREKVRELNEELNTLQDQLKSEEFLVETERKNLQAIELAQKTVESHVHAIGDGNGNRQVSVQAKMTLGQLLKHYMPQHMAESGSRIRFEREFTEWDFRSALDPLWQYKATMTTTANGWPPFATPIPRLAEFAVAGLELTDLFPTATTDMYQIPYYEETTRTNAAVETTENTAFPEASLATTLRTVTIVNIPVIIPVTDQQMSDVPGMADYVDSRLRAFVRERLDLQLAMGDGIAPNMYGIVNTPNVQTQAKGADNTVDAIYKAMDKVRTVGFANPGAVVINPTNFQPVRLMKDTTGNYIWGSPSEAGPMRMWGVPIVQATRLTAGTAQTGDYVGHTQLWVKQGVDVQVGYVGEDFKYGRQSVRATLRAGLAVYRPSALCNVTGL